MVVLAGVLAGAAPGIVFAQAEQDAYYEFLMARHFAAEGEYGRALAALRRAAAADPESAEIQAEMSVVLYRDGQPSEAEKVAKGALALDANNADANRVLGTLYTEAAQRDGATAAERLAHIRNAITHFERVAARGSRDIGLTQQLGRLYLSVGQVDKAIASLTQVVDENPFSFESRRVLAMAHAYAKDYPSAISVLEEISDEEPRALALVGGYQYDAGMYAEAAATFTRALAVQPANAELKEARIDAFYRSGQYDEAAMSAASAQKQHPDDSRFPRLQAQALYRSGREARAIDVLEMALDSFPRDAEVLNHLGYLLALSGQDLDEAKRLVRRALELQPDNGAYLDSLGWAHFKSGDLSQAEKYLSAAVDRLPRNPEVQDHLGDLHAARGRLKEAIEAWSRAMELGGDDIDQAAVKKKIEDARTRLAR